MEVMKCGDVKRGFSWACAMIICKVSKLDMPRKMWGDKVEWSRDFHCDDCDIIALRRVDDTIKWEERDSLRWYERKILSKGDF